MRRQESQTYEFGPFRINNAERLLRRGPDPIPLPPKTIETLLVLIENRGQVVEKEELLRRIWPDSFVEEGSLAHNVSTLRKALGETVEGTPYIETIPKRGYRFVVSVRIISTSGGPSLAVLPLENLSHEPATDFFADGMTDELISQLMKIEALRVCSRTTVMAYKGAAKPLRDIARELNVDWVVEGAVLHSGDRVRITACVIDAAVEKPLWAETYEREMRQVLALQSEVAADIARQIRVTVTAPEQARLAKSRAIDPEAYEAYLRGRYFWNKRTRDALGRAIEYFRQAVDKDPTYAPAHCGLADTYALLGSVGYDVLPPGKAMPLARAAAISALRIDDSLPEAHVSLGYVKLSYEWDWTGAEQEFRRAIELNPSLAAAHHWYGHCLFSLGRLEDAAREMKRALELDPLSLACNLGVGWSFYYARKYDQAIEQHQKTLEMVPDLPIVLYELGLAYQGKKLYQEALSKFEEAYAISGGEPAAAMLRGHAYALLGRTVEARRELATLEEKSKRAYVPVIYRAFIHAGLNDHDTVFAYLEQAYQDRSNYLIYLAVEPSLDSLRSDPRYQNLMQRMGLVAI
jgi:TolB-like protein/Tfp pilus assembly protein PilF